MANDLTGGSNEQPPHLSDMTDDQISRTLAAEQTDAQTQREAQAAQLVAKGNDLFLRQTRAAEAAGTFSQALQLAPNLLAAHLGMAEANFALGQFQITRVAAEYVVRLAPDSTDGAIAQALLYCLNRQFPQAQELLDRTARADPGRPYVHALRGYVLRNLHNDYDAALAEAKASRLASSVDLRSLFPRIEAAAPVIPLPYDGGNGNGTPRLEPVGQQQSPTWARPNVAQRRTTQVRFAVRGYPIVTYSLIGLNVLIFVLQQTNQNIALLGDQDNALIAQGQWWRLFTVMFLHLNILHIATNMLSLFFIGPLVERLYGTGRYLILYFGTGLIASLTYYFLGPVGVPAVGASGAIAGIFGVLGAFFFAYRQQLGVIANRMLQQWAFWLGLNVLFNITDASGLAWQAHLGGLVAGLILGYVLAPHPRAIES